MDSKCLESFLIPEYEIATEGVIGSMINGLIKAIGNAIKTIIRIFKGIINKLKMLVAKKAGKAIANAPIDSQFAIMSYSIGLLVLGCNASIMKCFGNIKNNASEDKCKASNDKLNNDIEDISSKIAQYRSIYKGKKITIKAKDRNVLINRLEESTVKLEKFGEILSQFNVNPNSKNADIYQETYNLIMKSIPKVSSCASEVAAVVNGVEITE